MEKITFLRESPKSKRLTVTLSPEVSEILEKLSDEAGCTQNKVVVEAIRFYSFVLTLLNSGSRILVKDKNDDLSELKIE